LINKIEFADRTEEIVLQTPSTQTRRMETMGTISFENGTTRVVVQVVQTDRT
jgi:hypothetical protein